VVDDEVHHQLHVPRVQLRDQLVELLERAEERVDVVVVGNVVAVVGHRRAVDRAQPDDVDTEQLEIVQVVQDSAEVTDAVTVAIGEAARIDLVDHGGLPPVAPGDGAGCTTSEYKSVSDNNQPSTMHEIHPQLPT
jgi:hypothetical protein